MAAIQAAITQITVPTRANIGRAVRMAKQMAITNLFGDLVTLYSMLPPYMDKLCRENLGIVVLWRFKDGQMPTLVNPAPFLVIGPSVKGFQRSRP